MTRVASVGLHLPFEFDPQKLKSDLALVRPEDWAPHYNERDYGGEWCGVALRSLSGNSRHLLAHGLSSEEWTDTDLLDRCPYFREILSTFDCPLKSVRLLSLAPGSFVREHSDPALGYEDGEVRIHIPIQTNSGVEFYSAGQRLHLQEGQCYYINVSLPHRVNNSGSQNRIHLVIDADVNDWVHALFRQGRAIPVIPSRPANFEEFRSCVLAEPELQRKLHAISEPAAFAEVTVQLGHELGCNFDPSEIGPLTTAETVASNISKDWVPVAVQFRDARPIAEWVYLGARRFTEPFFEDTIRVALRNPFARAFRHQTHIPAASGPAPSGFIFHMSRCGSTLISQMFAALPRVVMLSEAPAIDDVIQGASAENQTECLRSVLAALGQRRRGTEEHYIVKLDAWHIHSLPLIRAAFPDTPWIFVYRDPLEVLVSQLRCPGKLAAPGAMDPAALGLRFEDITALTREAWCVRVLAGFLRAALEFRDDRNGLFLNYRQLPEAVWEIVSKHFGIHLRDYEMARMREAARSDAKTPSRPFREDSDDKRREAPAAIQDLSARVLKPLYLELEAIGTAGSVAEDRNRPK